MNLQITSAGLAALVDRADRTRNVRITRVAVGTGRGPGGAADAGRAALRTERDDAAVAGQTNDAPRLAVHARVVPTAPDYAISEVGVFARSVDGAGNLGAELLVAYWTDPADTLAQAVSGVDVVVAVTVDVRDDDAAVTVDLGSDAAFHAPATFAALSDTPADYAGAARHLLSVALAGGAVDTLSAAAAAGQLLDAAPPRLHVFSAGGTVAAPDAPCRWLVAAWGAGGAARGRLDGYHTYRVAHYFGNHEYWFWRTTSGNIWTDVAGPAGGDTSLTPRGQPAPAILAAGGPGALAGGRTVPARPGRSIGGVVVQGAGAAGGIGRAGTAAAHVSPDGLPGDLAISLLTPAPGVVHTVAVGAGGSNPLDAPSVVTVQSRSRGQLPPPGYVGPSGPTQAYRYWRRPYGAAHRRRAMARFPGIGGRLMILELRG